MINKCQAISQTKGLLRQQYRSFHVPSCSISTQFLCSLPSGSPGNQLLKVTGRLEFSHLNWPSLLGHWVRSTHHNYKCWLAHMNLENKRFFVSDLFFLFCILMNINVFVLCFITFFNVFDTLYVQPLLKCYKIGRIA